MDYQQWAKQYAETIKKWGWIESIAQGWVQDLINSNHNADAGEAFQSLRHLK